MKNVYISMVSTRFVCAEKERKRMEHSQLNNGPVSCNWKVLQYEKRKENELMITWSYCVTGIMNGVGIMKNHQTSVVQNECS